MQKENKKANEEQVKQWAIEFQNGDKNPVEAIKAYRKIRAAYRDKVNIMVSEYRDVQNVSKAQLMADLEKNFPYWIRNYDPSKNIQMNTMLEKPMSGVLQNSFKDQAVGQGYVPRNEIAEMKRYEEDLKEAIKEFNTPYPTEAQIMTIRRQRNPGKTDSQLLDSMRRAKQYMRSTMLGDVTIGDGEDEGSFRTDDNLNTIDVDAYSGYSFSFERNRAKQFLKANFTPRQAEALEMYFYDRSRLSDASLHAQMDSLSFGQLRKRALEMAKKQNIVLDLNDL